MIDGCVAIGAVYEYGLIDKTLTICITVSFVYILDTVTSQVCL